LSETVFGPRRRFSLCEVLLVRQTDQQFERYRIDGLTCADCAARIERAAAALPGVREASLNFATGSLSLQVEKSPGAAPAQETAAARPDVLARLVREIEPSASLDRNDTGGASAGAAGGMDRGIDGRIDGDENRPKGRGTADRATRRRIFRVSVALCLFIIAAILRRVAAEQGALQAVAIALYGASYALAGYQVVWNAVRRALRGRPMDEYFLMTIATAGAWLLGESGEAAAVNRSRDAVTALLDLRPRMVRRLRSTDDTGEELVDPSTVVPGDLVVCLPGERIAVDGIIHQGVGALDTSAVTGESIPRTVEPGAEVHAGAVSYDARLVIRAVAREAESTVARMLALVEDAAGRKAPTEQMMTRLARYYTPLVVAVAGVVALVPPAVGLGTFETWIYRALVFLVVSCPCALVVSIPLGYFAGIGAASRRGILVKGGQFLDALARVQTVVFDKTGTITTGVFGVSHMISWHGPPKSGFHGATTDDEMRFREALLAAGYRATLRSNHPASRAIRVEGAAVLPAEVVALIEEEAATDETREFAGRGVLVTNGDERICAGSASHLEAQGVVVPTLPADSHGTAVHVGLGGRYLGCILVADRIRPSAAAAVRALRHGGVELVPEEKVRELESLMEDSRASGGGRVAFVGDGINDAAVIARADVGIAMGGIGSDAAVEAADVVLMGDDPGLVPIAIDGARRTQRIVMQNVVFALATKVVFLAAAASGLATMWMAVFADVGGQGEDLPFQQVLKKMGAQGGLWGRADPTSRKLDQGFAVEDI